MRWAMRCAAAWTAPMIEAPLLQMEKLSVHYGTTVAVEALSCALAPGRCLGVIGESGAGKTQAFLALMGLLTERARVSGSARLEGADMLGGAGRGVRARQMAMIFQDPMSSLTPHLTIGAQVTEPLIAHRGMDRAVARQ